MTALASGRPWTGWRRGTKSPMTVFLAHGRAPADKTFVGWVAITGDNEGPGAPLDLGDALEQARQTAIPAYLAICHRLGLDNSAELSHTPSAATNASDFLSMLAWTAVVQDLAAKPDSILVLCSDPWLYRHLRRLPGVFAARPPAVWMVELSLAIRGILARARYVLSALYGWAISDRPQQSGSGTWVMSYPHPGQTPDYDPYFADLPSRLGLHRILHVDGKASAGLLSLNAWGRPWWLPSLLFARWRPSSFWRDNWLVRRAAALDGSTAQSAAISWQIWCQRRWLADVRPTVVVWPWENHGWERTLVVQARRMGTRSIGYQHTCIGKTEFNHHAAIGTVFPDKILCCGPVARDHLLGWGHEPSRLLVAGALRYPATTGPAYDPQAPIFIALPGDRNIAHQMVVAAQTLARPVLIRPHPVYDVAVPETEFIRRAVTPLSAQPSVSVVVYAATTLGLEAVIAGLPTIRFIPAGCIALDILPNNISVPAATADGLAKAVRNAVPPPAVNRTDLFAPVDLDVWRIALLGNCAP